mmetsp:Transcript_147070/g.256778  ORF Transcript_147070/g.256778 Transcript_147070/m.256778 type:complete len:2281 (-) Transcript_147070:480-7322(-)
MVSFECQQGAVLGQHATNQDNTPILDFLNQYSPHPDAISFAVCGRDLYGLVRRSGGFDAKAAVKYSWPVRVRKFDDKEFLDRIVDGSWVFGGFNGRGIPYVLVTGRTVTECVRPYQYFHTTIMADVETWLNKLQPVPEMIQAGITKDDIHIWAPTPEVPSGCCFAMKKDDPLGDLEFLSNIVAEGNILLDMSAEGQVFYLKVTGPPEAPSNVRVVPLAGAAKLLFDAPLERGSPITHYTATVHAATGDEIMWTDFTLQDDTTPAVVVNGLPLGEVVTFTIQATNGNGTSYPCRPTEAYTVPDAVPGVPHAPQDVQVRMEYTAACFTWPQPYDGSSPIIEYTIQSVDSAHCARLKGPAPKPTYVKGLVAGRPYRFTVTATNALGTSAPSAQTDPVTATQFAAASFKQGVDATIPPSPDFDFGAELGDFTIEMWIKPGYLYAGKEEQPGKVGMFEFNVPFLGNKNWLADNNPGWQIFGREWWWGISIGDGTTGLECEHKGQRVHADKWHHLAFTYSAEARTCTLYMDGQPGPQATAPDMGAVRSVHPLGIGQHEIVHDGRGGRIPFHGSISNVRVWRAVRTAEEIAAGRDYIFRPGPQGWHPDLRVHLSCQNIDSHRSEDEIDSSRALGPLHSVSLEPGPKMFILQEPSTPTGVAVEPLVGALRVTVPSAPCNGMPVRGYTVTASPGNHVKRIERPDNTAAAHTVLINYLAVGTEYTVAATAWNDFGESAPCEPVGPFQPIPNESVPEPTTDVKAKVVFNAAYITWKRGGEGGCALTHFEIIVDPPLGPKPHIVPNPSACSGVIKNLLEGVSYQFAVVAYNLYGPSEVDWWSNTVEPEPMGTVEFSPRVFGTVKPSPAFDFGAHQGGCRDLTVEMWVKPLYDPALKANAMVPFMSNSSWDPGKQCPGFSIYGFGTYWGCSVSDHTRSINASHKITLKTGTWTHVAFTFEAATNTLTPYTNGLCGNAAKDPSFTHVQPIHGLYFGQEPGLTYGAGVEGATVCLSSVRMWSSVRTQVEIQDAMSFIYQEGPQGWDRALIASWPFTSMEGDGTIEEDWTPNGHDCVFPSRPPMSRGPWLGTLSQPGIPKGVAALMVDTGLAMVTWHPASREDRPKYYTVTCSDGEQWRVSAQDAPQLEVEVHSRVPVTFRVTASNFQGTSEPSPPSNPILPSAYHTEAVSFTAGSYATLPSNSTFAWGPDDTFQVEFWCKFDQAVYEGEPFIFCQGVHDPEREPVVKGLQVRCWAGHSDTPGFCVVFGDGEAEMRMRHTLRKGTEYVWHHVCVIVQRSLHLMTLYIDSADVATGSLKRALKGLPTLPMGVASDPENKHPHKFGGRVRDLRIWKGHRTVADVITYLPYTLHGQQPGLCGSWPFSDDQHLTDTSGCSLTGRLFGEPSLAAGPTVFEIADALRLADGAYGRIPPHPDLVFRSSGHFTIEFWIQLLNPSWEGDHPLFAANVWPEGTHLDPDYCLPGLTVYAHPDQQHWGVMLCDGKSRRSCLGGRLSDNRWHHIAIVCNRAEDMVAYHDGHETERADISDLECVDGPGGFTLGQDLVAQHMDLLPTAFSSIRIWDRARTANQVATAMQQRMKGSEVGLVGCWHLNMVETLPEASQGGGTSPDYSCSLNPLQLTGLASLCAGAPIVPLVSHTAKLDIHLPLDNAPTLLNESRGAACQYVGSGAIVPETDPIRSTCARFDGQSEVQFPHYSGVWGSRARTISAWIKIAAPEKKGSKDRLGGTIVSWGGAGVGAKWTYAVQGSGGKNGMQCIDMGTSRITTLRDLRDGQWHHVCALVPKSHRTVYTKHHLLYLDGELQPSQVSNGMEVSSAVENNLRVGGDLFSRGQFGGLMQDLRVYSRSLSAAEIKDLYYSTMTDAQVQLRQAVHFTGGSFGQVVAPGRHLLLGPDVSFTVEAWVCTGSWEGERPILGTKDLAEASARGFALVCQEDGTWAGVVADGATCVRLPGGAINDGHWHHIAMVCDRRGDLQVYQDGVRMYAEAVVTLGDVSSPHSLCLAQDGTAKHATPYAGCLTEVRVWHVARSAKQLAALAHFRAPGELPGLAGLWHLNTLGHVALDSSPTAAHVHLHAGAKAYRKGPPLQVLSERQRVEQLTARSPGGSSPATSVRSLASTWDAGSPGQTPQHLGSPSPAYAAEHRTPRTLGSARSKGTPRLSILAHDPLTPLFQPLTPAAASQPRAQEDLVCADELASVGKKITSLTEEGLKEEWESYAGEDATRLPREQFKRIWRWDWEHFGCEESEQAVDEMLGKYCQQRDSVSFEEYALFSLKRAQH